MSESPTSGSPDAAVTEPQAARRASTPGARRVPILAAGIATLVVLGALILVVAFKSRADQQEAQARAEARDASAKLARTMSARLSDAADHTLATNPESAAALARAALFALAKADPPTSMEIQRLLASAALSRTSPIVVDGFRSLSTVPPFGAPTGLKVSDSVATAKSVSMPWFVGAGDLVPFFGDGDAITFMVRRSPNVLVGLSLKAGRPSAYVAPDDVRLLWARTRGAPDDMDIVAEKGTSFVCGNTTEGGWRVVSSLSPPTQGAATQTAARAQGPARPTAPIAAWGLTIGQATALPRAVDRAGQFVAFATDDAVRLLKLDPKEPKSRAIPRKATTALWLAPGARALGVRGADERLDLYASPQGEDVLDRSSDPKIVVPASVGATDVSFSDDAASVAIASPGYVKLLETDKSTWDKSTFFEVTQPDARSSWIAVALSPKRERIGARRSDGLIAVWDAHKAGAPLFQRRIPGLGTTVAFDRQVQSLLIVDFAGGAFKALRTIPLVSNDKVPDGRPPRIREYLDALSPAVSDLDKGASDARDGRIEDAASDFERASKYPGVVFVPKPSTSPPDPPFDLATAREDAAGLRADWLAAAAHNAAQKGEVQTFETELQQLSQLADDPAWQKLSLKDRRDDLLRERVPALAQAGRHEIEAGDYESAAAHMKQVYDLNATYLTAQDWNRLCWRGTVAGQWGAVAFAGVRAVELDDKQPEYRDTRALSRLLTGDRDGARDDFNFYVSHDGVRSSERREWIRLMKDNKDWLPTAADLARIKDE